MPRYVLCSRPMLLVLALVLAVTLYPAVAWADPEPGTRIQVPVIDSITCKTAIRVQNVGAASTKAVLVLWGNAGPCAPQSIGPNKAECTGLLQPGSAWTFASGMMPAGSHSGIIYSFGIDDLNRNGVSDADEACEELFSDAFNANAWRNDDSSFQNYGRTSLGFRAGQPIAVEVSRTCPGNNDPTLHMNAAYTGISDLMEGQYDTVFGGFAYYVPLIFVQKGTPPRDYNTRIYIQNSGSECTSVEIYFQQQDQCLHPVIGEILALAPGETVSYNLATIVPPAWQGSAWLRASQPLGVVVDTIGENMFGSYRGFPAQLQYIANGKPVYSPGAPVNYAPLIYREYNGWQTGIQVQNLSSIFNAKVKVYFVDHRGGIITTIADWICPRGSQSFFLPVISGLPGTYVGAARIESQGYFSPGSPNVGAPYVMSVVNIMKYADSNMSRPLEMIMYNAIPQQEAFSWQTGDLHGAGRLAYPIIARRLQNDVNTEVAIQNINPNPGFTTVAMYFYDQNGLLDYVCQTLNEKQVDYIDFAQWRYIPRGFTGSLLVSATYTTQPGGFGLGGVGIERVGTTLNQDILGDESLGYEAFPVFGPVKFLGFGPPTCPGVP
ncbi:MAG: hypothetical protein EXR62_01820 [Chloroflexi bacterium]|nr:hypothetical protein [Chloroflexota bacterium]